MSAVNLWTSDLDGTSLTSINENKWNKPSRRRTPLAWPCGPWSPWQRMCPDKDLVWSKRRDWLEVFPWFKRIIKKQRNRGRVSMLENPWPSEDWNTEELQQVIALGLECNKIDMCSFNFRDRVWIAASKGDLHCHRFFWDQRSSIWQGVTGGHQHQPLEGKNAFGSPCGKLASTLWISAKLS